MKRLFMLLLAVGTLTACSAGGQPRAYGEPGTAEGKYRTYYEVFVRSFYDSNGDGVGDLNGLREKLGYIDDLGVGGIWLMPVMPSYSYHKYDVEDYYSIDPQYGTMADFEAFLAECKERSLTVLLDIVFNHTSNLHPWFVSASQSIGVEPCGGDLCRVPGLCRAHNPYCDYYEFANEKPAGKWSMLDNGWYYKSTFSPNMPDLNLDCAALREELVDIMRYWLGKGVDGFRLDAVIEYYDRDAAQNAEFLKWLGEEARAVNENVYIVGEAWTDSTSILRHYEGGSGSFFNFPFAQADGVINQSLINADGKGLAQKIENWNSGIAGADSGAIDAPFLSNHDTGRSGGFLKGERRKLAAAIYLWMPGNAFVYYGEEIGMSGSGKDENKRLPMLWSSSGGEGMTTPPPGSDQKQTLESGVSEQKDDADSLLNAYKNIIAVKRGNPVLARGSVSALNFDDAVCAYRVTENEQSLFVFHNLSDEAVTVSLDKEQGRLKIMGSSVPDGGKLVLKGYKLTLPPYASAVLG